MIYEKRELRESVKLGFKKNGIHNNYDYKIRSGSIKKI